MNNMLHLKKYEDRRIQSGHLWIYSNEIDTKITPLKNLKKGQIVTIENHSGKIVGKGYVNPHNLLCARILTKDHHEIFDVDFFKKRIVAALKLRELCFADKFYRLIYSESDLLPGLIVDRYEDTLVVQFTTAGMENLKDLIISALIEVIKPQAILLKNDSSARNFEELPQYVEAVFGEPKKIVAIKEYGIIYNIPIWEGQKTGWFYDQNKNRELLKKYVKNKRVLDIFSYIGAWGINAAFHGASEVLCIDSSKNATDLILQNAKSNNLQNIVKTITADAFDALKQLNKSQELFDTIIIDPPAFIKKQKDIKEGFHAYLRIHGLALQLLKPNGIIFTTSCSQHLTKEMLLEVLQKAATNCNKNLSILEQLHQASDHPLHPNIVETEYLKGFIVYSR